MKDRVKNLCKQRGVTLKDLAAKIGIARESLTRALDGNPTLSTVRGIANGLEVPVWELFAPNTMDFPEIGVFGVVVVDGVPHRIESKQDLETLLKAM